MNVPVAVSNLRGDAVLNVENVMTLTREGPWTYDEFMTVKNDKREALLEKKRAENIAFDAAKRKKERERYWRAHDCRPPKKRSIGVEWPKAIPPAVLEILINNQRRRNE